jgi:hypothetical protein
MTCPPIIIDSKNTFRKHLLEESDKLKTMDTKLPGSSITSPTYIRQQILVDRLREEYSRLREVVYS